MLKTKIFIAILILLLSSFVGGGVLSQLGWVLQQSGTTQPLHSLVMLDSNTVFVVGDNGTLLKTTNGGANFYSQFIGNNNSLYGIYFPTYYTGYIVSNGGGSLVKTTNRGNNWNLLPGVGFTYPSIFFVDANIGYITSYGPPGSGTSYIFKTTNGGVNWSISYHCASGSITSICFIDVNTGFAGGTTINNQGFIFKTTNSGSNWLLINSFIFGNSNINSMSFINSSIGYLAGTYIMKTTNTGINWEIEYAPFEGGNELSSIFFADVNTGYAVGTYGNIVKTSNGGINWNYQQNLVTNNLLTDVKFINSETGYAVGYNGTIIKTTTGGEPIGIKPKGKTLPLYFSLSQNYPNPFNPSTRIEFQLPKNDFVKLSVFDVLGNEIATLINEKLDPGLYNVEWNALNYSSGIYFYMLETKSFSDTKKMILIK